MLRPFTAAVSGLRTPRPSRLLRTPMFRWVLALAIVPLALSACGGDDEGGGSGTSVAEADAATATVITRDIPGFEEALATNDRRPLWVLSTDPRDGSSCTGACAEEFVPLTPEGELTVGPGVDTDKISTFAREDGTQQVAYDGQALYSHTGKGLIEPQNTEEYGGTWYLVSPSGDAIVAQAGGGY